MDGRCSRSRCEESPPETWSEGSPKAGTSCWTGSWPGSKHDRRLERAEMRGMAMGEGAGASGHAWMFSGWSDAEAERFVRDHFVSARRLTLQKTDVKGQQ